MLEVAQSYLRQARARSKDAREALSESNYPYAVKLSQECVELSLKAVLEAVGIDYSENRDVSDVLMDVKERFPDWFRVEVDFLYESSKILAEKRETSLYGGEVIDRNDAEAAAMRAKITCGLCESLVDELEKGNENLRTDVG